jgi:hypothetical protein
MKIILALLLLPSLLLAQGSGTNVQVNKSSSFFEPEEVSIAINPKNPNNIIGGANLDWYYYSTNKGKTWTEGKMPGPVIYGDPMLYFDMLGNAYYCHLGPFGNTGILIARSSDGGATWSSSKKIYGNNGSVPFMDKEWLTSDRSETPFKNNLYISWTQFDKYGSKNPKDSSRILFSRSTDFGETFSLPIQISKYLGDAKDGDSTVEGAVPCVSPDGKVYVAWSGPQGIVFTKSTDGGLTFPAEKPVVQQIGGWTYDIPGIYRSNGLPFTDCDISNSEYRGTIYINYSDSTNGDHDIFIIKSTDEGETWSLPIRVNDDKIANGKEQFMSHFCVDPVTGVINVLFYDRRNYEDNKTDVYIARSSDGGETFINTKISESPFTPTPQIFFGDYIGISSYNNLVSALWMRLDETQLSIKNFTKQF